MLIFNPCIGVTRMSAKRKAALENKENVSFKNNYWLYENKQQTCLTNRLMMAKY